MSVRGLLVASLFLACSPEACIGPSGTNRQKKPRKRAAATKLVNIKDEDVRKVEFRRRDGATPVVIERDKANEWQMRSPEPWRVDQTPQAAWPPRIPGSAMTVWSKKSRRSFRLRTAAPAVELTVSAKDGKSGKLLIGDETPDRSRFLCEVR